MKSGGRLIRDWNGVARLDQDFNSLDAQHEACSASIASQRHEGWVAIKTRYDDGGISGGTLDRPALQRILTDIDAGQVQMVVAYKIDRLTRSLADFAKLVERLDAAGCSFVSVTQAFNTASSMGRLTFERAAFLCPVRARGHGRADPRQDRGFGEEGLWMGGVPPLGYDPHPDPKVRGLVVKPQEAETVQAIFALYDELGYLNAVRERAMAIGLRSKRHVFKSGRVQGGMPFSRGQIYALLRNPIYTGKIRHKAQLWAGQHEVLIEEALWQIVQANLRTASARQRGRAASARQQGPGSVAADRQAAGRDRRSNYPDAYQQAGAAGALLHLQPPHLGWRRSERLAFAGRGAGERLCRRDRRTLGHIGGESSALHDTRPAAGGCRTEEGAGPGGTALRRRSHRMRILVSAGAIEKGRVHFALDAAALAPTLGIPPEEFDLAVLSVEAPFALRRRGVEGKLIVGDRVPQPTAH